MQINLLGPLVVITRTGRHYVRSRQVGSLLALLALSDGGTYSSSAIEAELWPAQDLKNTRNALHATVSRLRRFLTDLRAEEEGVVLFSGSGHYRLEIPPGCVDALTFVSLVREAEASLPTHPRRALELYELGLDLWGGPALEDVGSLTRLGAEKARLDEMHLSALEGVAESRLRLGENRRAVSDLRHLVEIHGDREHLTELLMVALYRGGQQTEALDVFERIRMRLDARFGMYPSRSLQSVQQAILMQDHGLELDSSSL